MPPVSGWAKLVEVSANPQNSVRVDLYTNGKWKVAVPQRNEPIVCATLAEARRAGYVAAVEGSPCELVVRDAYHRVLAHEHLSAGVAEI
jgi:hypothetical protein